MPDYSSFRATSLQVPHPPRDPLLSYLGTEAPHVLPCPFPSQQYNLATANEAADAYTVFAPNNDA